MTEDEGCNPFVMARRAAKGDLEAQRAMADEAASRLAISDLQGFYEGLAYARLAAAQGDAGDSGRVISLLALAAHLRDPNDTEGLADLAGQFLAYAIAAQDKVPADAADKFHDMLNHAMDNSAAGDLVAAKHYQDLWRQANKTGKANV